MAASPSVESNFTFVGGLNTEGSFFVTPKNNWKEGENVIPSTDGSVSRRKGIDYEVNYQLLEHINYNIATAGYTVETWSSVNGDGNLEFFVVQNNNILYFYRAASGTVSASLLPFTVDLTPFRAYGNVNPNIGSNVITAVSCYGKLLVTNIDCDPILITYDAPTNTVTTQRVLIRIRDFTGIRSPAGPTAETTQAGWEALSFWPHALYNLYNQGWTDTKLNAYGVYSDGFYPANSKQWIYGKDINDDFSPEALAKQDFGTSEAPKGRVILEAFKQDRASYAAALVDTSLLEYEIPTRPNQNDQLPWYEQGGSPE